MILFIEITQANLVLFKYDNSDTSINSYIFNGNMN